MKISQLTVNKIYQWKEPVSGRLCGIRYLGKGEEGRPRFRLNKDVEFYLNENDLEFETPTLKLPEGFSPFIPESAKNLATKHGSCMMYTSGKRYKVFKNESGEFVAEPLD